MLQVIAKRNKWVVGDNRRVETEENQNNPQITQIAPMR